jgi:phospholipid/cholesterol/gamma-HCH transport system ATP-binding protein
MSKKQRVRMVRQMGMLFQKNALFDSLSCSDNLRFPLAETTDLTDAEIERRTTDYLDAVGLLQARDQFPDEISGGMQKRLGIARALALDPKIIFYDDPSAGLDPITSRMIISLILRLKEKHNSTIITVTNDMNRAYQLAGRIFMVVDQTVIEAGDPVSTKQHSDPRIQQFIHGRLKGPLTEAL